MDKLVILTLVPIRCTVRKVGVFIAVVTGNVVDFVVFKKCVRTARRFSVVKGIHNVAEGKGWGSEVGGVRELWGQVGTLFLVFRNFSGTGKVDGGVRCRMGTLGRYKISTHLYCCSVAPRYRHHLVVSGRIVTSFKAKAATGI